MEEERKFRILDEFETLDGFIEKAVGDQFTPDVMGKLSPQQASAVYEAIKEYHKQFVNNPSQFPYEVAFPRKRDGELRVGFFKQGRQIDKQRKVSALLSVGESVVESVKRMLLFSHSLLIDLPFFVNPFGQNGLAMLPGMTESLSTYAHLADLIKGRVVIPIFIEPMRTIDFEASWLLPYGDLTLSPKEEAVVRLVATKLVERAGYTQKEAKLNVIRAMMTRAEVNDCFNIYDPFIREPAVAEAYVQAILATSSATTKNTLAPLYSGFLHSSISILPDKLSIDDIVIMRKDDELFDLWRRILSDALLHLYRTIGLHSDEAREFRDYVRDCQGKWQDAVDKKLGKGIVGLIKDGVRDVAVGLVGGALIGTLINSSKGLLVGAGSGAVAPLVRMFGQMRGVAASHHQRLSFANHFMTIGAKSKGDGGPT